MHSLSKLQEQIALDVRIGYKTRAEMIADARLQMPADYTPEWADEKATALVDALLQAHQDEQRLWASPTDCDLLDEAFAELDRNGIIARQHFTCCQSCGHTEINTLIKQEQAKRPVQGYVFFHQQDTQSAIDNGYFYMAYGSVSGKERASIRIAELALDTLQRAGLNATWNGWVRSRICINDVVWQRRRIPSIFAIR
ncbi:MAG: hypothetical protein AAFR81_20125 [Chloroflexota bacterium]